VIQSFQCAETEALHNGFSSRKFQSIERAARKRLRWLHAATDLKDLGAIGGNHLEALKGNRIGQHSMRINDRWRICFRWHDGQAYDVEIVDYH
jgi:proteic killer suppression protein